LTVPSSSRQRSSTVGQISEYQQKVTIKILTLIEVDDVNNIKLTQPCVHWFNKTGIIILLKQYYKDLII